jgi:hypothetical protein
MRRRRAFTPQVWDVLEDRAVPSLAAVAPPPILVGQTVALSPQVRDSSQVHAAFDEFARSYFSAVNAILLAPDHGGVVDPAANRPAFDAAVKHALETLAQRVVASLGDSSTGSNLTMQVVDAILGDGAGSLESQLMALSTSAIEGIADAAESIPANATESIQQAATRVSAIIDSPTAVAPAVAQAQAEAVATASTRIPDDAPTAVELSKALPQAREAFGAFLGDYYRAVRDVLLATGADGIADASAARQRFDARVDASLKLLVDTVSRELESASAPTTSMDRVRAAIEEPGTGTLETQLASLATPENLEAATVRAFTIDAFRAVTSVFSLLAGDLAAIP